MGWYDLHNLFGLWLLYSVNWIYLTIWLWPFKNDICLCEILHITPYQVPKNVPCTRKRYFHNHVVCRISVQLAATLKICSIKVLPTAFHVVVFIC